MLTAVTLDVTDPTSVAHFARAVKQEAQKVDCLINSAGMLGDTPVLRYQSQEEMMDVFCTNAVGPLLVTQELCKARLLG